MGDKAKEFTVLNGESYQKVIEYILSLDKNVFLLEGDVGLGKTTFTSEFVEYLAIKDGVDFKSLNVMSPTYNIINEYKLGKNLIFHADFYRLENSPLELEEVLESVEASKYSFIEWHKKMNDLEPNLKRFLKILFVKSSDHERVVTVLSC